MAKRYKASEHKKVYKSITLSLGDIYEDDKPLQKTFNSFTEAVDWLCDSGFAANHGSAISGLSALLTGRTEHYRGLTLVDVEFTSPKHELANKLRRAKNAVQTDYVSSSNSGLYALSRRISEYIDSRSEVFDLLYIIKSACREDLLELIYDEDLDNLDLMLGTDYQNYLADNNLDDSKQSIKAYILDNIVFTVTAEPIFKLTESKEV